MPAMAGLRAAQMTQGYVLSRVKPYCEICQRCFYGNQALKRHLERHKINRTKYRCIICGNEYSHEASLNRHKLVHR